MITSDKAVKLINSSIKTISSEKIDVCTSVGRILNKPIKALIDSPPFNMSSMDGYALKVNQKSRNIKIFKVVKEIFAGENINYAVKSNQAIRIFTGTKIPKDSNTVVIQENVKKLTNNYISINKRVNKYQFIRKKGQDYKKGSVLFQKGHKITTKDIGLIVSTGINKVSVYKKPNVAVIATGNELVLPKKTLKDGEIYASSLYMIKEMIKLSNANCTKILLVKDNESLIKKSIKSLKNIDLLITTGGVSVGKKDLIKKSLEAIGFKKTFWKILVKPGKPLLFGFLKKVPVFGLPGNPVSSYICFLLFVIKALEKLQNNNIPLLISQEAILLSSLSNKGDRESYIRGKYLYRKNKIYVKALKDQDSSMLKNLSLSNCLIKVSPHNNLKKNQKVSIILLPKDY